MSESHPGEVCAETEETTENRAHNTTQHNQMAAFRWRKAEETVEHLTYSTA